MADSPHVGKIIGTLLELHRMSNAELGRHLKVSRQTIGDYVSGETVPGLTTLIEISRIFNVSLSIFGDPEVEKPLVDNELRLLAPEVSSFFVNQFRKTLREARKARKGRPDTEA